MSNIHFLGAASIIFLATSIPVAALDWPVDKKVVIGTFGENQGGHFFDGLDIGGGQQEVHAVLPGYMEIIDAISARRAYRFLSTEALPESAAELRSVDAGHLAPSCFNNQPWNITATSGEALETLRAALARQTRRAAGRR